MPMNAGKTFASLTECSRPARQPNLAAEGGAIARRCYCSVSCRLGRCSQPVRSLVLSGRTYARCLIAVFVASSRGRRNALAPSDRCGGLLLCSGAGFSLVESSLFFLGQLKLGYFAVFDWSTQSRVALGHKSLVKCMPTPLLANLKLRTPMYY